MANKNDERILQLKKAIADRREELKKIPTKFIPKTNCMLTVFGNSFNLHTTTDYMNLILPIKSMMMAAEALGRKPEETIISGFPLSDWYDDINTLEKIATSKEKKKELDRLETQLDSLLSSEKVTELKVDNLAALIGNI